MSRLDDIIRESLRSIYGASQPNYSGRAAGGTGDNRHGGGAGKPGYPVPDGLEDDEEQRFPFMKEGEAPLAKSPIPDDAGAAQEPTVTYSDQSDLTEGGNAMGTDRVPRENVGPTIEAYKKQVLSKVKHKSVKPVGSTGKKASSGDIDLGLDTELSLEEISAILKKLGIEHKVAKGLGEINSKFPQYTPDGKPTKLSAQVDLMVGPEAWTQFSYYGPGESESKYKALPRTGLVLGLLRYATEEPQPDGSVKFWSISPAKGVFQKVGRKVKNKKGEEEFKSDRVDATSISDPEEVAKLISKGTGTPWSVKDLAAPFEQVWAKAKSTMDPKKLEKVKGYLKGFLKGAKHDEPSELGEANEPEGVVFRGLRGLTPQELAKLGGNPSQPNGSAVISKVDKKGYWSANPKLAMVYATTAATAERKGNIMAILRGRSDAATKGSAKALNPGTHETRIDKIWWSTDPGQLKAAKLDEGGGISHLEDMKPQEFLQFLAKYKDLPLKGGLEVSEKVDGSARMEFGAENGKLWTKSKNGTPKKSSKEWPDKPMFAALKNAHKALESKPVGQNIPPNTVFTAEVLYTKIPNSIEYGPNVIMIHGVHKGDAVLSDEASKKVANDLIKKSGGQLTDGKDPWKFEYKRVISPEDVMVDVKEEFTSLGQIYQELKKLEPDKLKAAGKGPYKAAMERFSAIQKAVKEKLVGQLRKQKSSYGPEGGDVEGIVFRDLENGALTKLVDKDLFTKLNQFNWKYRGLIGKGTKVDNIWRNGVISDFRKRVATDVIGKPEAASTAFGRQLSSLNSETEYPKEADTPEKKNDYLLGQWVKKNKAFGGKDPVATFKAEITKAQNEMKQLEAEWAAEKKKGPTVQLKGQTRKMDPLVMQRTDTDFQQAHQSLDELQKAAEAIGGLKGDLTKKVAIMKLFLGQHRLERLQGGGEEEAEESVMREAPGVDSYGATQPQTGQKPTSGFDKTSVAQTKTKGAPKATTGVTTEMAQQILKKNIPQLAKRGINVRGAHPLGKGTRGVAFDVGGKVLKITNDEQEAVASYKLMDVNLKHVARFSDVFRFREDEELVGAVYGILQEKLAPFPGMGKDPSGLDASGEAAELNRAILAFNLQETIYRSGYNWDKTKEACQEGVFKKIAEKYPTWKTDEIDNKYAIAYAKKMNVQWDIITKKVHIDEMVQELNSKGIKFHDYHAGNIMVRQGGVYVLIDIGYSKVAGGKEPPVLENKVPYLDEGPPNRLAALKAAQAGKKAQKDRPMMDVVRDVLPLLKKKGIVKGPLKPLGHGAHGIAFDIGAGRVLKVTDDILEAKSSNHLKDKKLKHVVHIFDVFQLPGSEFYGIVEEKLAQMSAYDKKEFELVTDLLQACKAGEAILSGDYGKVMDQVRLHIKDKDVQKLMDSQMKDFQLPEIIKELAGQRIEFLDYHEGNLMMRGNDYVVIDLGLSQSPGAAPPVLERIVHTLMREFSGTQRLKGQGPVGRADDLEERSKPDYTDDKQEYVGVDGGLVNHTEDGTVDKYARNIEEAQADTVGVTIGRYQPFHRGHAEVIRKLANTHTKTIVLVAGNTPDKKNPFSYETRLKLMKASLPDVWRKLEVYKATSGGKNSGFVPGILSDVAGKGSALKGDTACEILVGPDRFEQMKQQIDRSKEYKAQGKAADSNFDPDLAVVKMLPGVKNDDDTDRISGTRLRQALAKDDRNAVKSMLDPHVTSNQATFESIYKDLKDELAKNEGPLREDIADFGGENAIMAVIKNNGEKLRAKGINADQLHRLGAGQVGVAYDMGNNKVFKATTSPNEAKSCLALKGKTLPHVVKIDDVFRMIDRRNPDKPLYGIIREKLHPLSPAEKTEVDDLVDDLRSSEVTGGAPHIVDYDTVMKKIRDELSRDLVSAGAKNRERIQRMIDQKIDYIERGLKKYQIDQMMAELKQANIMFADYKGDNIMKRGGEYVLSDPGGRTNGGEPPVLEKIMETIISEIGITMTPGSGPGGTQAGLRAGSSGWSSPQNMFTDEDVAAYQEAPEEFELWSDKLKGVDTAKAIGEEIMRLLEKTQAKTSDRASNQFEHLVAKSLQSQGIDAKAVGGNDPKKADVEVTIGGKSAYIEAKYTEAGGANLVSARMKLVDGKWQGSGEQTGFTAGIAKDLETNPDAQKFLKELHAFVAKSRKEQGLPVPKVLSMPSQGKPADIMKRSPNAVTPDEINAFIDNKKSAGKGNRYIYLNVGAGDVQQLVAAHYKYKNAPYMQFGNDFYLLGDEDPFGLSKLNPPVPQFEVTSGRKGVRVASRTGRYEIIPELKALKVTPSPYSLVDPKKKFPFKKQK